MDQHQLAVVAPLIIAGLALIAPKYIIGPFLIKSTQKADVSVPYAQYDPNTLPPEISGFFYSAVQALTAQGFTVVAYLTKPNAARNVTPVTVYLINYAAGEKATIAAFYVNSALGATIRNPYFEYTTRFTDDTWISTNNVDSAGAFKESPKGQSTRIRGLMDSNRLYAIHRFIVERDAKGRQKYLPPRGEELAHFHHVMADSYESQRKLGIMNYDETTHCYTPTWYGAFYMTYAQLFPFKEIRQAQRKRIAGRAVADFERRGARAV